MTNLVGFSNCKNDDYDYYEVVNTSIALHYVGDFFDGKVFVYKSESVGFEDVINYVFTHKPSILNVGTIRFHRTYDACLCLLTIPYFTQLYNYIINNHAGIDNNKKRVYRLIKKQLLVPLADKSFCSFMQNGDVIGAKFYRENDCYIRAVELIELIDNI